MTLPSLKVEIAFATDPGSTPTWVDVSSKVLSVSTSCGRQTELDQVQASTCSIRLDNGDRRFDPTYTGSPYYPNVLPMRKVRVSATYSAVTYYLFTGFITAWPMQWDAPAWGSVTVTATDGFEMLSRLNLTANTSNRVSNWSFESDTSGWTTSNGTLTRITTDSQHGVACGKLTAHASVSPSDAYALGSPGATNGFVINHMYEVTAWIFVPSGLSITLTNAKMAQSTTTSLSSSTNTAVATAFDTWQKKSFRFSTGSGFDGATGLVLAASLTDCYVYFELAETGASKYMLIDAIKVEDLGAFTSLTEFNALVSGGPTPYFPAETTGLRVSNALNAVDWPHADRALDPGIETVAAATITAADQTSALAHIQEVADVEPGIFFIDGQGRATFHDRDKRYGTSSVVTLKDSAGTISYQQLDPHFDVERVYNDVTVQRSGGTAQNTTDATSIGRYFRRPLSLSPALTNDIAAHDRATFELAMHKDPRHRFERLVMKPQANTAIWPYALGLNISDKVTVQRSPKTTPHVTDETISKTSFVEGISHDITPGEWTTTLQLSPGDLYDQFFTLDSAVLDDTATANLAL